MHFRENWRIFGGGERGGGLGRCCINFKDMGSKGKILSGS